MTIRKVFKDRDDLKARINEAHTQKILIDNNKKELSELQKKLALGDTSVAPRIKELMELIDQKVEWLSRNEAIIRDQLAS